MVLDEKNGPHTCLCVMNVVRMIVPLCMIERLLWDRGHLTSVGSSRLRRPSDKWAEIRDVSEHYWRGVTVSLFRILLMT